MDIEKSELRKQAYELCLAIESKGCSLEWTDASVKASEVLTAIIKAEEAEEK